MLNTELPSTVVLGATYFRSFLARVVFRFVRIPVPRIRAPWAVANWMRRMAYQSRLSIEPLSRAGFGCCYCLSGAVMPTVELLVCDRCLAVTKASTSNCPTEAKKDFSRSAYWSLLEIATNARFLHAPHNTHTCWGKPVTTNL